MFTEILNLKQEKILMMKILIFYTPHWMTIKFYLPSTLPINQICSVMLDMIQYA